MSTYTDLHNKAKETLNVDYCSRVTPQKVHFVNPENTYKGVFFGKVKACGNNNIFGGTVTSVILSSSVLDNVYFRNGLNIDSIQETIESISTLLTTEISTRAVDDEFIFTSLCNEISTTNFNLETEKTVRKNADDMLSIELTKTINYEVALSIHRDCELNKRIDTEISDRTSADIILENRVNDKMLHDRHLEMHIIDNREFPLLIHDYSVNTYVDSNANAYVYVNGDEESRPIGRIEKVHYENGFIESFEFNAFANHPYTWELTGAGMFQYYFDKNTTIKYTGVGSYRLNCSLTQTSSLNNIQFTLDSANNNGYYNVYFRDSSKVAGTLESNYKHDSSGMISACSLTINSIELSNFAFTTPYKFTANGETKTFKGKNGNWCEATLSDNVFYFYDKHSTRYYLPVRDYATSREYGRIYDGNVILAYDGSLKEIGLDFDVGKHFRLNEDNGFKQTFDPAFPYKKISYSEVSNIIQIIEEKKYYKYLLNGDAGSLIPGLYDVPNRKIDESYETLALTLNIDSASLAEYVNGEYTLRLVDAVNKYQCEKDLKDNFGKIKLTFVKDARVLFVDIMPISTGDFVHLSFDVSNILAPIELDRSRICFQSKRICNDIKHPTIDEKILDEKYDNKFVLEPDLTKKEYSGESKVLISVAKTAKKDTLTLMMPDKRKQIPNDYNTASSKFILNFKVYTESLQDCSFVSLIIKSFDATDKFYYMNKEVDHIYIKKNKWTTLQFLEIRPHRYIINDLDYSEIDWRIKWLHAELSAHEVSSYAHIMKLSDDVEFLLSVDRDDMSYKGTLPFLSAESWIDKQTGETKYGKVTLSAFVDQSQYICDHHVKFGDMFKLSAAQWGVNKLYDKNNETLYLGEKDYFVINAQFLCVANLEWKDLDIFRNPETETSELCSELMHQINATSSYLSSEINRICAELSTEISACELSIFNLSVNISCISSDLSTVLKLSVDELQRQIVSNDNDIAEISDKVDFLLSVDKDDMSYKGTLPFLSAESWIDPITHETKYYKVMLSAFVDQSQYICDHHVKFGDMFKLSAAQWGVNKLYDKNNDAIYLGENDYFVINSELRHVSSLVWKDLDIFRNPEIEASKLCSELMHQISSTSSYISVEVDRISTELSTELSACELSVNGLSVEVDRISTELSTTLQLSVDELQNLIVSNDIDIAEISDKVDFLLSVDPEKVSYKGTVPYYRPIHDHDEHNWQLSEYMLSALANQRGKYPKLDAKQGDLFRVGIAPISAIYDYRKDDNNKIKFGNNDYFIVNKDVKNINDIKIEDIDIIRDAQTEVETLSSELAAQISSISANISSEIVRVSTELSTELSACELSVNGLSVEVDRISTELSTTLQLSVDELQNLIVSNDIDIAEISDKVDFLLSVDPEKVSYKGTVPFYRPTNPTDIHCWQLGEYILSALANQRGSYPTKDLKQGDLFRVGIAPELALYDSRKNISHIVIFGDNDYFIANKDVKNINDIKIEDIDIIRDAQMEVEALSCILADQIYSTSSYISAEVNRISAELSTEISACELSVNGLSIEVDRISTELSTTLKLSVDELQRQIVSNDVDISEISDKVDFLLSVDQDKVSYKGTIPEYEPYQPLDIYSWQLFEYISYALNNQHYRYPTKDLKQGDLFRVGIAPRSAIYDYRKNLNIKFGTNDYILINKDVKDIFYIKIEDIDIIRDAQTEVETLSSELTAQIIATSSYISSEVNRISTELSTEISACELSVNGLSVEVDRISTELSTTLKLSVDELQNQIVSNDVDISEISDKVDFLLSVDPEKVSYKGTVPFYKPFHDHDEYNWQISEYILSALANQRGRYPTKDLKQGDLFRVGIAPASTMYDYRRDDNHKFNLKTNDYILINKDVIAIADLEIEDFDIIRDAQKEVEVLSCELSALLNATSSYISAEVNRISAELSTELSACELSVNGLSISIDNLSTELYETSSYLNGQVKEIWNDIRGGVNYKGHLSTFFNNKAAEPQKNPYDLSDLFGYFYNTHGTTAGTIYDEDATGKFIWKNSIPVNNGWMYCVKVDDYTSETEGQIYTTKDGIKLSDRDYIIIHSHELSSVQLSNITRDNIDIIETQDDDYVRLAKLREVSAWLFNDYTDRDLKLSTALSNEIDKLALSVDGISSYVDKLELSVAGLSAKTASICSELSIAHNFLSNSLSSEIQKLSTALSNDVDKLSADLSSEIQKLSVALSNEISCDAMHYKGNLIFDPNDNSLTATFIKTFNSKKAVIKLGDIFRFDADHTLENYDYEKNDFIIFTKKTVADSVASNDFVVIKDYDKEIERQYAKITSEVNVVSTLICLSVDGISSYVDKLELSVAGLSAKTASICSELSIAHNFLSNSLSSEIQKLSTTLSIDVKKLSADLSSEIQKLSTSLSNTTKLSVSQLCSEIIANDNDISAISTDLSVLENHYDRTFDEMFYSRGTVGPDLSVDVLNIVDKEETDNQYTLQFLSGTLVLVKKTI